MRYSIGWIAKLKQDEYGDYFGGHEARCKVYDSYKRALRMQKRDKYEQVPHETIPGRFRYINKGKQSDEDILEKWDILEAFVELPD